MDLELLEKNLLAYNASVRAVLSDKNCLSYLLQKFVGNFKDLDRSTIESLIGDVSTNDEVYKIYGLSNEDTSYLDGTVKFDLLFTTRLPNSNDKVGMLINLELQSEGSDTDLKRMIYYCNRMLVSEKGRLFSKDEYKDIVKVGAIWICIKNNKDLQNSINVYSIKEDNIEGNYHADVNQYDLMEIVTLYLGNELNIKDLDPLNILFKSNLKLKEIFKLLEEEYNIHLHMETKQEVVSMCDLGEGIYKEGIAQGKINLIINKMKKKSLSAVDAMIEMDIDEEEFPILLPKINAIMNSSM